MIIGLIESVKTKHLKIEELVIWEAKSHHVEYYASLLNLSIVGGSIELL